MPVDITNYTKTNPQLGVDRLNALETALVADETETLRRSKTITNSGVNLVDIALPAGAVFNGELTWGVEANDGTDYQSFFGISTVTAVNKAGTITSQVTSLAGVQSKTVSTGTLTVAVTVVNGASKITLVFTPTTSLTITTTTFRVFWRLVNYSAQAVTIL